MKTLCTLFFSLIYPMFFAVFSSAAGTETPPGTLVLQFKPGWSIFSANMMPDNPELTFIFQPLINSGKLIKIQDENGNALEDYGFLGGWINNIGNFQQEKGYKIKVNAASTLSFTGQLTVLPFRIPLKAGWNLMGFPLQVTEDAKAVVQQLIDRNTLVKVQDDEGNAIEDFGVLGGWLNNIGMMVPGKGYKIKLSARDTLVFAKPNTPPVFTGTIANITLNQNTSTTIDLKTYFSDDETPSVNLTYYLEGLSLGTYSITDGVLTITGTTAGSETDLRASASDEGTAANSNYFGLTVNDVVQKSTVTFKFRNAATNTDLTSGTSTLRYKKTGDASYTTVTSTNGSFTIDLDKNIAYEIDGSHSGDLETSISEPPTYVALKRPGDMEAFEQRAFQDSSSPATFTNATETIYVYKLMSGFPIMEMIDFASTDGNGINNGTRKFSTSNSTAPLWVDLNYTNLTTEQMSWLNELKTELSSLPNVYLSLPIQQSTLTPSLPYTRIAVDSSFPSPGTNATSYNNTTYAITKGEAKYPLSFSKHTLKIEILQAIGDLNDVGGQSPLILDTNQNLNTTGQQIFSVMYLFKPKTKF